MAWTLAVTGLLLATLALPAAAAVAGVATRHRPPLWLVKSNDLAALEQQAALDGTALRSFTWVGCGGQSDPDPCHARQDPIFTSYWTLRARARAKWAGTAIFDIEGWHDTPAHQRLHPQSWICRAARLHRIDRRLKVIITPWTKPDSVMIAEEVAAAKCGAYGVDIQSQFINGRPRALARFIHKAVRAIRRASRHVIILAGLATNYPQVVSARVLTADYNAAQAGGVQGFWLNAKEWLGRNRCTATQGGAGCPQIGVQFLADIGMTRAARRPVARLVTPEAGVAPGLVRATGSPLW